MPVVRPFRALRYDAESVGALDRVISPPYDVVSAEERVALAARDPRNVIRIELPVEEPGEEPEARYRRAARLLAAWRSDGTLRKDPRPSLYVYEQTYRVPGGGEERSQRGVFARLRLEPLGPTSGVRPHERTLAAAREDRYRLLRATGTNISPVVVLHEADATTDHLLSGVAATPATAEALDDAGVRHRLWVVPEGGPHDLAGAVAALGERPVTIADGHHRYETALRYRDERRMTRSCEEDPAFDYVLALFLSADQPLTVLPTHRILAGVDGTARRNLRDRLPEWFDVASVDTPAEVVRRLGLSSAAPGGRGRFGYLSSDEALVLEARASTVDRRDGDARDPAAALDVAILGRALESLAGIGPEQLAAGVVTYTHDVDEAVRAAAAGAVVFLLEPTPVRSVLEVAAAGGVMPQKSTYFHPKAATGLVLNPHEW